jgi:hypothetical protein
MVDSPPLAAVPLQVRSKPAIEVPGGGLKIHWPPAPSGSASGAARRAVSPWPDPQLLTRKSEPACARGLGCQP